MTANGWLQIAFFILAILLVTRPLGLYLVAVYEGRVRWLAPVERLLYRAAGLDPPPRSTGSPTPPACSRSAR
jgi:potassium-transporting ATPase potassium-binding subunit